MRLTSSASLAGSRAALLAVGITLSVASLAADENRAASENQTVGANQAAGASQAVKVQVPNVPKDLAVIVQSVDQTLSATWSHYRLRPTPPVRDLVFLRRIWLDLAGQIPPVADVRAVQDSGKPMDRDQMVRSLLESDAFANHWGRQWTEYLTDARPFEAPTHNGRLLQNFLRDELKRNTPYDQIVRQLVEGDGLSDVSGPVNFLLRYGIVPAAMTGAASDKFLGISLKCAECHDHPHAAWKQADFWGLAAYFARLRKMTANDGDTEFFSVIERSRGELLVPDRTTAADENGQHPRKAVFPKLPGENHFDTTQYRLDAFIRWLTAKQNVYFGRHTVNRVWEMLLGRPLVPSLDQAPATAAEPARNTSKLPVTKQAATKQAATEQAATKEPATQAQSTVKQGNSSTLDVLTNDFLEHDFDVRRLVRVIVMSQAYQRSAGQAVSNLDAIKESDVDLELAHFSRFPLRPLSADQVHLSLVSGLGCAGDPNEMRLAQLTREDYTYDLPVATFAIPAMTPRRAMAMLNSDRVREAIAMATESAVRKFGAAPGAQHIEWLFLCLLTRPPSAAERDTFLELVAAQSGTLGLEDAAWVLVNSAEFNTNH